MKAINLIITSAFLVVFSCTDDERVDSEKSDVLTFGHFYGECGGESCVEIFKLTQSQLFEDRRDKYPKSTDFYDGDYTQLSEQQFNTAKDLVDYFPLDLLTESSKVIGQPDAGDWGGLYIEYNYEGTRRFWLLDKAKSNVPTKYHDFIDRVSEKIRQLR